MIRGLSNSESIDRSLGLGPHLVGKQIDIHGRSLDICKELGEGGFSFVYLVRNRGDRDSSDDNSKSGGERQRPNNPPPSSSSRTSDKSSSSRKSDNYMVLKITSVHNTSQRHMAEKEAKLLQMLSHPSIVQVYDHGFLDSQNRVGENTPSNSSNGSTPNSSGNLLSSESSQHLILLEYCEGGTAFDAIKRMNKINTRFDLPSLVISFGQICNAVSYLHAQRPPIIHRDLKPVNFLIKNGAYKLCDFGSAVVGHTDLRSSESRRRAEELINRSTTQMFRAPEMVDLYMAKRLTQSTDVWALGCCLYSLAFLCDCFEEGSNLAILSGKYKIPENNPYGASLVDLIGRMLARDYKERADMSEVIMCLSALYSNRPLPKRKWTGKQREDKGKEELRSGAYRTDGQGISQIAPVKMKEKKIVEAKKLNPNSAAAKRKKASEVQKQKSVHAAAERSPSKTSFTPSMNFASFDDTTTFSSAFDERCQISSSQAAGNGSVETYFDEFSNKIRTSPNEN